MKVVGAVRFELTTSWTRTKRASQTTLRPDTEPQIMPAGNLKCNAEKTGAGEGNRTLVSNAADVSMIFTTFYTQSTPL